MGREGERRGEGGEGEEKMKLRISLPTVTGSKDATVHAYPYQVAYQTLDFIQASVFHASLSDIAAGKYVRQPNAINNIESDLTAGGMTSEALAGLQGLIIG